MTEYQTRIKTDTELLNERKKYFRTVQINKTAREEKIF